MLTNKRISVVTPCYNDAGCVREMHRRVTDAMKGITSNYEIIYVNDCSPDNAMEVLRGLAAEDKKVIVISHSRNFGNQAAYTTGMRYATGDAVITLDGDIQDPPELFPEFVKKWLEGYKVVYGMRVKRKNSFVRKTFYKIFYKTLQRMSYVDIPLDAGDFALIDREVLDIINNDFREVNRYIRGMRAYVGFRSIGIPYTHTERFAGVSNFSVWGYFQWAKKMILSFSYKPLEWISYVAGFTALFTAFAVVVYIPLSVLIPGFRGYSLALLVMFLGSVQLLSLSAIAEYLAIIFEEIKHRPMGIVEEIINGRKEGDKKNV